MSKTTDTTQSLAWAVADHAAELIELSDALNGFVGRVDDRDARLRRVLLVLADAIGEVAADLQAEAALEIVVGGEMDEDYDLDHLRAAERALRRTKHEETT